MSEGMTQISPELALIDPELAAAARALLSEPADCLASRHRERGHLQGLREGAAPPAPSRRAVEVTTLRDPQRGLRRAVTVGMWVVLAGMMASPLLAFLPPKGAPHMADEVPSPLPPPAAHGRRAVSAGPTLQWQAVPRASVYNLILVRGAQRFDMWPTKPNVRFAHPALPGAPPDMTYAWFVYPGFMLSPGKVRYGAVVAHGLIAVRPGVLDAETPSVPCCALSVP